MKKTLWLVKNKHGEIFGPHTEQTICSYIEQNKFDQSYFFSAYPTGKWQALSARSIFYEKILDQIQNTKQIDTESLESSSDQKEKQDEDFLEKTQIIKSDNSSQDKVHINLSKEFQDQFINQDKKEDEEQDDIIEMEKHDSSFISQSKQILKVPFFVFIGLLACSFLYFNLKQNTSKSENHIRILPIKKQASPWSKKDIKIKMKGALISYFKGTTLNFLNTQKQLVNLLGANPSYLEAYPYLCMTYLEIWPFAHQDTQDKKALNHNLNLISRQDKTRHYSDLCKSVQAFLDKNFQKSMLLANNSLNTKNNQFTILLFYIKSMIFIRLNANKQAESHLKSLHSLRPKWTTPYMLSANLFYKQKKYDLAAKMYQKVLSIFAKHDSANLRMGILEYKYFKNWKSGKQRLQSILKSSSTFINPTILLEAYLSLSHIYLKQNNKKQTLIYVNKAYSLDPENPDVFKIKQQLGQETNFDNIQIQSRGLIYKGDLLVDNGLCEEAQKYFKKAYDFGTNQEAQAALRMAKCYWSFGNSGQAVHWLKKSINSDGTFLEAYFLLASYLADLYQFEHAKDILQAVKHKKPSKHNLFKAYANLAFSQKQYATAASYAKQSLKFYTSDVEIYILLSKIYYLLENASKALLYADKALNEDTSALTQITYAYSLNLAYSPDKAQKRFEELIKKFPNIQEYTQALGEFYFKANRYQEALKQFEKIILKKPDFKPAYIYLGRIYTHLSKKHINPQMKHDQAIKYFLKAGLLDISDPEPPFRMGQAYLENENYKKASREFKKVLKINSNYPLIQYYIALVYFYKGGEKDLDQALTWTKLQSVKMPNHFLPYKLLGDIYRQKAKGVFKNLHEQKKIYDLCAKSYQQALKFLKNNIEISSHLLECYKGSGNLKIALQFSLQLIKEKGLSGHAKIYKEIGSIYEIQDQYYKARYYYNNYFQLMPGAKDRSQIQTRIRKLIKEKKNISL